MEKNSLVAMGALCVSVSFVVGCAADQPDGSGSDQPAIESAAVVCGTLQEINDEWFRTPTGDESPDDFVASFRNLSARLAGEVSTWSGETDASIRSAAELVSQDLSVINAFNAEAPDNVEESNKFIETLDSFEEGIDSALSLCTESGALESSETGSTGADNPIRFELSETVEVESLASSDFQTSLTRIMSLSNGQFMIVDRPMYRSGAGPYEGMYFRYFDSESLLPVRNVNYDMGVFSVLSPDSTTFAFHKDGGCGLGSVDSQREVGTFAKKDVLRCFSDFSYDGSQFYFTDRGREGSGESASVRVVDVETLEEIEPFPGGQLPRRVDATGGFLFVEQAESKGQSTEYLSVIVLKQITGENVFEIPLVGSNFESGSDSDQIFFTSKEPSRLWEFDTKKLEVTELARFANAPLNISVSPDGAMVAVSHFGSEGEEGFIPGWVSIYDVRNGEVVQELEIPGVYTGSDLEFVTNNRLIVFKKLGNWVDSFHVFDLVAYG